MADIQWKQIDTLGANVEGISQEAICEIAVTPIRTNEVEVCAQKKVTDCRNELRPTTAEKLGASSSGACLPAITADPLSCPCGATRVD
jgi:hypothetical protein